MNALQAPRLAAFALLAFGLGAACRGSELSESTFQAMRANRCEAAVEAVNKGLVAGEVEAYYLTGLMYLRGLCVTADPAMAPRYLEPAAKAAHADAARYLTMIYGMGLGVPQSYAQAGRWLQAWVDIFTLRSQGVPPPSGTLDVQLTEQRGVLGTVAALVQERVQYPRRGARLQASEVNVKLILELGPEGLRYGLFDARSGIDDDVQSMVLRRSNEPHLEAIETVVDKVLEDIPPYPRTDKPQRIAIPYRFRLM